MKGIILAGGSGTRLAPATSAISKQLLPVYDKPMIYYPLSVLMLAEIREVLIICTPNDLPLYRRLLKDGAQLGMEFQFSEQFKPRGLAEAFLIGEQFIGERDVTLVLGDNLFFGSKFTEVLNRYVGSGARIFGHRCRNPSSFGVVKYDDEGQPIRIIEKPQVPPSNVVVTGLYQYDGTVAERAKVLAPSARGELEITDLNNSYLADEQLELKILPRGTAWLDSGTPDSLLEASNFIRAVQNSQGMQVACIEEIAFNNGWIEASTIETAIKAYGKTHYGEYLRGIVG